MLDLLSLHRQPNSVGGDKSQTATIRRLAGRVVADNLLARHLA